MRAKVRFIDLRYIRMSFRIGTFHSGSNSSIPFRRVHLDMSLLLSPTTRRDRVSECDMECHRHVIPSSESTAGRRNQRSGKDQPLTKATLPIGGRAEEHDGSSPVSRLPQGKVAARKSTRLWDHQCLPDWRHRHTFKM